MSNISNPGTGNLELMEKIEKLEQANDELKNSIVFKYIVVNFENGAVVLNESDLGVSLGFKGVFVQEVYNKSTNPVLTTYVVQETSISLIIYARNNGNALVNGTKLLFLLLSY